MYIVSDLVGATFHSVFGLDYGSTRITLIGTLGSFALDHTSEAAWPGKLESVIGDSSVLINNQIILAENSSTVTATPEDMRGSLPSSRQWKYELHTAKGVIIMNWRGVYRNSIAAPLPCN